jgi:hypothetical protein
MSYPERSRSVRFGPAVPDSHVSVGHPLGVAPERVSKAGATDGSVRDRQKPFDSLVGGFFHFAITTVSSRAAALDVNARSAGRGLPGDPNFRRFGWNRGGPSTTAEDQGQDNHASSGCVHPDCDLSAQAEQSVLTARLFWISRLQY